MSKENKIDGAAGAETAALLEKMRDEYPDESWLFDTVQTGDIILVPMRINRHKTGAISFSFLHPQAKSGIMQTAPAAFYYLHGAQATCSMCDCFKPFRYEPLAGYCAINGEINAYRETCPNFRSKD